jgi:hypothetical protein
MTMSLLNYCISLTREESEAIMRIMLTGKEKKVIETFAKTMKASSAMFNKFTEKKIVDSKMQALTTRGAFETESGKAYSIKVNNEGEVDININEDAVMDWVVVTEKVAAKFMTAIETTVVAFMSLASFAKEMMNDFDEQWSVRRTAKIKHIKEVAIDKNIKEAVNDDRVRVHSVYDLITTSDKTMKLVVTRDNPGYSLYVSRAFANGKLDCISRVSVSHGEPKNGSEWVMTEMESMSNISIDPYIEILTLDDIRPATEEEIEDATSFYKYRIEDLYKDNGYLYNDSFTLDYEGTHTITTTAGTVFYLIAGLYEDSQKVFFIQSKQYRQKITLTSELDKSTDVNGSIETFMSFNKIRVRG